ncbi:hypothetical protein GW17_00054706 [Ensete ventricosum]|uniref:Uncharacterized protein n=1 Tax=Ensete ventricosum TaxID=4639 RepID=A0A444CCR4_ENSVE|nr:hypothetical protein GW17_00054706 [Ensete ventricosum]RZR71538.1 hypothetical protein BHM03_00005657 [Ensete ventricosum]
MGSISSGEGMAPWEKAEGAAKEERILVSVRVRPLNAKEIEKDDPSDWECHEEREFVLKFSAMEIYNEAVRDLLSTDSSPLRLLDDPEVE